MCQQPKHINSCNPHGLIYEVHPNQVSRQPVSHCTATELSHPHTKQGMGAAD